MLMFSAGIALFLVNFLIYYIFDFFILAFISNADDIYLFLTRNGYFGSGTFFKGRREER